MFNSAIQLIDSADVTTANDNRASRGYVSEATLEHERDAALVHWQHGERVPFCRSAFTVDEIQWARIAAALAPITVTDDSAARAILAKRYDNPHPDSVDLARVRALLPFRRSPRNDFKTGAGVYPFPVYVATYDDGTTRRYSFWTRKGKPLDYAAGYNVALILGRDRPISGYVEYDGRVTIDPVFSDIPAESAPKVRKLTVRDYRARMDEIAGYLAAGQIEAAQHACAM